MLLISLTIKGRSICWISWRLWCGACAGRSVCQRKKQEREKAQQEREKAQRECERADRAERQFFQSLIFKVQKKYRKGKTLEQTADELEEEPDAIRQIYEEVSRNPEKPAEEILNLVRG